MEKAKLINFINKYHLGGLIQSVAWSTDGGVSTRFISDDNNVVGEISLTKFDAEHSNFGIYNTDLLLRLLGVLGNDINFQINSTQDKDKALSLTLDDKTTSVNFMLADLGVVPPAPKMKSLPPFELSILITKEFIDKFIKAKAALGEAENFTIAKNKKTGKYQFVIGNTNSNSNRINIDVDCTATEDIDPINFSTKYFREILASNKDLNGGTMIVSSEGLAQIDFDVDEFQIKYFLVKTADN